MKVFALAAFSLPLCAQTYLATFTGQAYNTGLVSLTAGSKTVQGQGTAFTPAHTSWWLVTRGRLRKVAAVSGQTLTLADAWTGATEWAGYSLVYPKYIPASAHLLWFSGTADLTVTCLDITSNPGVGLADPLIWTVNRNNYTVLIFPRVNGAGYRCVVRK